MNAALVKIITSTEPAERNHSLETVVADFSTARLLSECEALDAFRRSSTNLYERVRALFFLSDIHRFVLPLRRRYIKISFSMQREA